VNGEGFLLDDVAVPEIGYSTDFESDDGGWLAEGFVRIQNLLPQTFRLAIIRQGRDTTVEQVVLPESNQVDIPITLGKEIKKLILVVSGTTRFTRQDAHYTLSVLPR